MSADNPRRQSVPRFSRPCYDKYHRCPGWAGPGVHYARTTWCDNGRIEVDPERPLWRWRFHRCDTCGVLVLPYVAQSFSPFVWIYRARRGLDELRYRRESRTW